MSVTVEDSVEILPDDTDKRDKPSAQSAVGDDADDALEGTSTDFTSDKPVYVDATETGEPGEDDEDGEEKVGLMDKVAEYMRDTSAHGLGRIVTSVRVFVRIAWVIAVLGSFGVFFYQTARLTEFYLSLPVYVAREVVIGSPTAFPAITVCNLNSVKSSEVGKGGADFVRTIQTAADVAEKSTTGTSGRKRRKRRGSGSGDKEVPGKDIKSTVSADMHSWLVQLFNDSVLKPREEMQTTARVRRPRRLAFMEEDDRWVQSVLESTRQNKEPSALASTHLKTDSSESVYIDDILPPVNEDALCMNEIHIRHRRQVDDTTPWDDDPPPDEVTTGDYVYATDPPPDPDPTNPPLAEESTAKDRDDGTFPPYDTSGDFPDYESGDMAVTIPFLSDFNYTEISSTTTPLPSTTTTLPSTTTTTTPSTTISTTTPPTTTLPASTTTLKTTTIPTTTTLATTLPTFPPRVINNSTANGTQAAEELPDDPSDSPFVPEVDLSQKPWFVTETAEPPAAVAVETSQNITLALQSVPLSVQREMGHKIEDMIQECSWNGKACSPRNFTAFSSRKYGNCYTFNSDSANPLNVTNPGAAFGLSVTLYIEQHQYVPALADAAGVRVLVHRHDQQPFPEDEGFDIRAGMKTSVVLRMRNATILPDPYSDCLLDEAEQPELLYSKFYSVMACQKSCIQRKVMEACGCGLAKYPIRSAQGEYACGIPSTLECAAATEKEVEEDIDQCKCPLLCRQMFFSPSLAVNEWPSIERETELMKAFSARDEELAELLNKPGAFRKNFVRLEVYYNSLYYELITEEKAYSILDLITDLGSSVGLYTGISVLTLAEIVPFIADLVYTVRRFREKRKVAAEEEEKSTEQENNDADIIEMAAVD